MRKRDAIETGTGLDQIVEISASFTLEGCDRVDIDFHEAVIGSGERLEIESRDETDYRPKKLLRQIFETRHHHKSGAETEQCKFEGGVALKADASYIGGNDCEEADDLL